MKKSTLIYLIIFSILLIGGAYLTTTYSFSTIGTIDNGYQCRIVKDGNVCDSWEQCSYIKDRDVSCIKGYEIISFPDDLPDVQRVLVPVVTQGGESK